MISGALISHYVGLFCRLGVVVFIRMVPSVKNPHLGFFCGELWLFCFDLRSGGSALGMIGVCRLLIMRLTSVFIFPTSFHCLWCT